MGGPCDFCVSPSPFGLDFGTLDFGTSDLGLTIVKNHPVYVCAGPVQKKVMLQGVSKIVCNSCSNVHITEIS